MGAQAPALLLPLLAQWLLRAAPAPAPAPLTLPLRVAAPTPGPGTPAAPRAAPHADGLALALEPAGGAANFLAMVDNLQGDSGRGYYLEMLIGTPPQKSPRYLPRSSGNRHPQNEFYKNVHTSLVPKRLKPEATPVPVEEDRRRPCEEYCSAVGQVPAHITAGEELRNLLIRSEMPPHPAGQKNKPADVDTLSSPWQASQRPCQSPPVEKRRSCVVTLQILVDTGSSNFAVAGAPHSYVDSYFDAERSSTYHSKGFDVTVKYTQGSWTGFVGEDVVTIPKGFNSSFLVNIATIFESENFFLPGIKWNGILGLAYAALAKPSSSLETFFDSLVAQAKIPDVFSMQMCGAGLPVAGSGTNGGSLVLGGIEPSLYKGDIWYTPIKEEWYYQIEILKLEIGGQSLNLDCREIPEFSDGFWTGSQLACWTNSETPWSYFPKISIYLRDENSSQSFRVTILPQLYIQPMMGAGLNYECYRFGISPSTNALVIGATVMEGFYVIFDRARKRVGFAASPCAETAGAPVSEISGPFSTDDVASNCVPALPLNEPILWIVSYTLMSVCGIILLILIILLLLPFRCRHLPRDPEVVNDESSLVRHRWK
ncbi:beta-secretase 2 isoform X2 [Mirounga angustirostris]|uniref:beta-secretase 2 isoform X2 n=1 Tax=Mirounga angustirostris TaxID=9716 RepID=UPI00313E12A4